MRTIEYTTRFRRDYRREQKGRYRTSIDIDLMTVVDMLAADEILPPRYRDHSLTGTWVDHRDCHIKPDLVLIYRIPDALSLQLVRLGSHSELGL